MVEWIGQWKKVKMEERRHKKEMRRLFWEGFGAVLGTTEREMRKGLAAGEAKEAKGGGCRGREEQ